MTLKYNYFKTPNCIFELNLTPHEMLVLFFFLKFSPNPIFPSLSLIAKKIGISVTSIKKALKSLRKKEYLSWKPGRTGRANVYSVHLQNLVSANCLSIQTDNLRNESDTGDDLYNVPILIPQPEEQEEIPLHASLEKQE